MTVDTEMKISLDSINMPPETKEKYYLSLADAFINKKLPADSEYLGEQECIVNEDGSLDVMFHVKQKDSGEWDKIRIISFPPNSWNFKALG